ncbi:Protein of unknown function [Gryllus bimaculatus]|nr:Protein of unknown function [Gryllus bimaculatus]
MKFFKLTQLQLESNSHDVFEIIYTYDQCHWCPIVFIVINGFRDSSNRYNNPNDANAIKLVFRHNLLPRRLV